ncbi:hypothetical protein C8Q70DRAFT_1055701 [Cubamyces menziesii]|nr:hypothetical protein C8Q70DRAFT_1055701 [Cubamyces menziesii]
MLASITIAYAYPRGLKNRQDLPSPMLSKCSVACIILTSPNLGSSTSCVANAAQGGSGQCVCDEVHRGATRIDECVSKQCTAADQEEFNAYLQQTCSYIMGYNDNLPRELQSLDDPGTQDDTSDDPLTGVVQVAAVV